MGLGYRITASAMFIVRAPIIRVAEGMFFRFRTAALCASHTVEVCGQAGICAAISMSFTGSITAQATVLLMRIAAILVFDAMRDHSGIATY